MDREEQVLKAFAEKLALTDGRLIIGDDFPHDIGKSQRATFDVLLPDGSIGTTGYLAYAPSRVATREEWLAGILAYRGSISEVLDMQFPYYYVLSFD